MSSNAASCHHISHYNTSGLTGVWKKKSLLRKKIALALADRDLVDSRNKIVLEKT